MRVATAVSLALMLVLSKQEDNHIINREMVE